MLLSWVITIWCLSYFIASDHVTTDLMQQIHNCQLSVISMDDVPLNIGTAPTDRPMDSIDPRPTAKLRLGRWRKGPPFVLPRVYPGCALSRQQLGGNGGPTHSGGRNLTSISSSSISTKIYQNSKAIQSCCPACLHELQSHGSTTAENEGWNHWNPTWAKTSCLQSRSSRPSLFWSLRWTSPHSRQKKCTAAAARIQHLCWDPLALTALVLFAMRIYEAMNSPSTTQQGFEIQTHCHVLCVDAFKLSKDMCP